MFHAGEIMQRLRERAYLIYLERLETGQPGDELSDWLEAERQTGLTTPYDPAEAGFFRG